MKPARLPTLLGMCLLGMCLVAAFGCAKGDDSGHEQAEPPAKVDHPVDEQKINRVVLTEKARERLGIALAEIQRTDVPRRRKVGGEVVVPAGQTIVVSAPITGLLAAPLTGAVPSPGSMLAAGQPVFRFTPWLTPAEGVSVAQTKTDLATAQIEAQRQIESAKVEVEAAQIAVDRAMQLFENKAGSRRAVDEAEAALRLAQEAMETAKARYGYLSQIEVTEDPTALESQAIVSPVAGVLQGMDVAPGETVSAGEPLFRVVRLDRVWIRVPVYVGYWRQVDTGQPASIAEYGQSPDELPRAARYVSAPPSADAATTSVDLVYELDNEDGRLYPGQKVETTLSMRGSQERLVVPSAAVLYDIHGGAWVYEELEPLTYARRRVEVNYVDGPNAVLERGPEPGTKVVTDGAVELFGTEFTVQH